MYATGGASSDFAQLAGIKYSFTLELRDRGDFGFLLPSIQIIPTAEETLQGLLAVWTSIAKLENLPPIDFNAGRISSPTLWVGLISLILMYSL